MKNEKIIEDISNEIEKIEKEIEAKRKIALFFLCTMLGVEITSFGLNMKSKLNSSDDEIVGYETDMVDENKNLGVINQEKIKILRHK